MLKFVLFVLIMVGALFILNQLFPAAWHTVLYSYTFGKGTSTTTLNLYPAYLILGLVGYLGLRIKVA